jgi:DNA-binding ferritin-like protein
MEPVAEFLLTLLHSVTNAHLAHWSTQSYAQHVALGEFYDELQDLTDSLAEQIMGKYEQIITFPTFYVPFAGQPEEELKHLSEYVMQQRTALPQDSEIQNSVDSIADLIDSTLYKLRFLK